MEVVERNQHSPFVKAIEGLAKIRIKNKKRFVKQASAPDREKTCAYIPIFVSAVKTIL